MIKFEILGTGCLICEKLAKNAEMAAHDLGLDYKLVRIEDIHEINRFGVMMLPALAINGKIQVRGKVARPQEIKDIICSVLGKRCH